MTTALQPNDVNALAKQFAYATASVHGTTLTGTQSDVLKNACGMALQRVMRERNHGLDKLPAVPATIPNALSALLLYMLPTDTGPAPAATSAPAAPAATTAPTTGSMSFDAASLTALRDLATSNATAAAKPDPIVLGHSKVEDGGTLRWPEFFSVCDVAVFEAHEARLTALSEVPKGEKERTSPLRRL